MEKKYLTLPIDSKNNEGIIEGYASVFNVKDHHNDIVEKGAFTEISHKEVKLLWQHKVDEPIGVIQELREDAYGLFVKAKLLLDLEKAKEAHSLMKAGVIKAFSIGFTPVKEYYDKNKTARIIKKVKLWEISLVTFPANNLAEITDVKNNQYQILLGNFNRIIKTFQ